MDKILRDMLVKYKHYFLYFPMRSEKNNFAGKDFLTIGAHHMSFYMVNVLLISCGLPVLSLYKILLAIPSINL